MFGNMADDRYVDIWTWNCISETGVLTMTVHRNIDLLLEKHQLDISIGILMYTFWYTVGSKISVSKIHVNYKMYSFITTIIKKLLLTKSLKLKNHYNSDNLFTVYFHKKGFDYFLLIF